MRTISSRDDSAGSIAARNERGADRRAESRRWTSPDRGPRPPHPPGEDPVLRTPRTLGAGLGTGPGTLDGAGGGTAAGAGAGRTAREPALLRGESAERAAPWVRPGQATGERRTTDRRTGDRRGSVRRAADAPVPDGRTSFRLGDVYAEELARLREHARQEGYAAGLAEGCTAAETVVAEAERAAEARLAEVQARWERRMVERRSTTGSGCWTGRSSARCSGSAAR